ncbi:unnamed protein product [Strongylus vulgaris]|uniref:Uncharacterized protein n=1 Tax=Strongylus vulgaris TaxID=40348 RepID=A0A3P7IPB5_STRVU|nr:unnamed protein product [Strongylus vulgaris]
MTWIVKMARNGSLSNGAERMQIYQKKDWLRYQYKKTEEGNLNRIELDQGNTEDTFRLLNTDGVERVLENRRWERATSLLRSRAQGEQLNRTDGLGALGPSPGLWLPSDEKAVPCSAIPVAVGQCPHGSSPSEGKTLDVSQGSRVGDVLQLVRDCPKWSGPGAVTAFMV